MSRRLYFVALGIVSLIAFLSLWSQIHGLIGKRGILPAEAFFKLAHQQLGASAYLKLPSLCWVTSSDLMLHMLCAAGAGLSVLLIVGFSQRLVLVLLWGIYLSLCVAGQAFLGFQWDTLLLEMYACSVLYAPSGVWARKQAHEPMTLAKWLLWGLAFKLMFLSGVTKLLSGDGSWHDGTALQYHYYTQPIPNWISWYAAQWPLPMHQLSLLGMFLVELVLPFLVFTGQKGRAIFGVATIVLMLLIEATGNFGFFNLQTIVLCIPLLNDEQLRKVVPSRWMPNATTGTITPRPKWRLVIGSTCASLILVISFLTIVREMVHTQRAGKIGNPVAFVLRQGDRLLLSWAEPWILDPIISFRTVNGYGLFRVMTTHRPEIVVEISDDGQHWQPCEFPYKPGRVDRPPPIVAPHMPRLDWQMWFAALNPRGNIYWLSSLMERILQGDSSTARLMGQPDLAKSPPRFVRLVLYEYKFSSLEQRRATGAWWSRSFTGELTRPQSRIENPNP